MIDPKKISTLGITFGALAIAAIGLVSSAPEAVVVPPVIVEATGSGHAPYGRSNYIYHAPTQVKPFEYVIPVAGTTEEDDEEQVITLVITELIRAGIF